MIGEAVRGSVVVVEVLVDVLVDVLVAVPPSVLVVVPADVEVVVSGDCVVQPPPHPINKAIEVATTATKIIKK